MSEETLDFKAIHEAFRAKIVRYLTRLVGEGEAEDVAQEVFVKVSRSLAGFRGQAQLSTWIYRIATNAAIDRLRSPAYQHAAETASTDGADEIEDVSLRPDEETPSIEQYLMRKEMYECFERFVGKLPLSYRTVVALSDVEGLTNIEIATILGLSLDTVKIRLHRGRDMLIGELKAHCKAEDWL